jgi:hypothetical protein
MDSAITEMLEHLQGWLSNPTEFFEVVQKDFQEHREDFDGFRSAFEGRGLGAAGEQLIKYLDDHGRLESLTKIANERPDELAAGYLQLGETDTGDGATSGDDAQDALWQAAINQFGTSWAAWDGTDTGWAEYRDWFYDATNTQDPNMYALAYERLDPLNNLDPDKRIGRLREFGFDLSGTEGDDATSGDDAQDALWQAAINQFGTSWAAWDGTDTGWAEYRDWFYDATNTQDPNMYALAYERLDPLNNLDPNERIGRLREFGFDVSGTEVLESPADTFDEEKATALRQQVEQAALASPAIADTDVPMVREAFEEVLSQVPGASRLTTEQIADLMAAAEQELSVAS